MPCRPSAHFGSRSQGASSASLLPVVHTAGRWGVRIDAHHQIAQTAAGVSVSGYSGARATDKDGHGALLDEVDLILLTDDLVVTHGHITFDEEAVVLGIERRVRCRRQRTPGCCPEESQSENVMISRPIAVVATPAASKRPDFRAWTNNSHAGAADAQSAAARPRPRAAPRLSRSARSQTDSTEHSPTAPSPSCNPIGERAGTSGQLVHRQ